MGFSDDGRFGAALASGVDFNADGADELLVGAPDETSGGVQRGAARLLLGGTPVPARYGTAKVNSTGCTPAIGYSGAPSSTLGGGLHVTATNVLPNKSGMLFWGLASSSTPFHGGTLLVAPPLIRTAAQVSGGSALCSGHYDFHFSQAYMAASGLSGGTTVYAQYWSRDPGFAHPDNVGLTNALRFTVAN
jgi:hypothetical protein